MKIIFAGTPPFAAVALEALIGAGYQITAGADPTRPACRTRYETRVEPGQIAGVTTWASPAATNHAQATRVPCATRSLRRGCHGCGGLWAHPAYPRPAHPETGLPQHSRLTTTKMARCCTYPAGDIGGRSGNWNNNNANGQGSRYRGDLVAAKCFNRGR